MFEFLKNEWELFLDDLGNVKNFFKSIFGKEDDVLMLSESIMPQEASEETVQTAYENDGTDHKVSAYFGEDIDTVRQNTSGDRTQHEVLRDYAQFFKPYPMNHEMCNCAFRKYYDTHALEIATEELPISQLRILQNNADIFIQGQESFGENNQFIDSRVDSVFQKVGNDKISKVIDILHDKAGEDINYQGERMFAEIVHYMVDNSMKIEKDGDVLEPTKEVLENKLNDVHVALRSQTEWNDEYLQLLSSERKYLYSLNRIEQYETEQKIAEFEQRLSDLSVGV